MQNHEIRNPPAYHQKGFVAFVAVYALRHMIYAKTFFIIMNQGLLNWLRKKHIIIGHHRKN